MIPMKRISLFLLLVLPVTVAGDLPSIEWDVISKGQVRRSGPWNSEDPKTNFWTYYFARGSVLLPGEIDRFAAHAFIDGEWVENPCNIHVEPLTRPRENGTRGVVLQIPMEAVEGGMELFLSTVRENEIQYTFPSWKLELIGKQLTFQAGTDLPPGTHLAVVAQKRVEPHPRTVVTHGIIPEKSDSTKGR